MQMTLAAWLIVTAVIAVHIWLFRQSVLWGFLGLTLTKHVVIAYLCHILGVDKDISSPQLSPTLGPPLRGPHGPPIASSPARSGAASAPLARSGPQGYNDAGLDPESRTAPGS